MTRAYVNNDGVQRADHERIAVRSLKSKMQKDPKLSRSLECQSALEIELPAMGDSTSDVSHPQQALVESRLLSSKVLAKEIAEVVLRLRAILGADMADGTANPTGSEHQASTAEVNKKSARTNSSPSKSDASRSGGGVMAGDGSDDDDGDDDSDESSQTDPLGEVDGGRVETEDNGWESGTVGDLESQEDRSGTESGVSESDQPLAGSSSAPPTKKSRPTPLSKDGTKEVSESAFLPSLSVGYIRGDSDGSDWSDAEADVADLSDRKNRRGQRARKA